MNLKNRAWSEKPFADNFRVIENYKLVIDEKDLNIIIL